jgi:hypothetical protein
MVSILFSILMTRDHKRQQRQWVVLKCINKVTAYVKYSYTRLQGSSGSNKFCVKLLYNGDIS